MVMMVMIMHFDLKYTPSITRDTGHYHVNIKFCRAGAFRS